MLSRFFKKEKSNVKTQAPKSRKLRMEYLEDRALLSVAPLDGDAAFAEAALIASIFLR